MNKEGKVQKENLKSVKSMKTKEKAWSNLGGIR